MRGDFEVRDSRGIANGDLKESILEAKVSKVSGKERRG
jgi:hypothetical protein